MTGADRTPTPAPADDAECWPFPCRDWHGTAVHLDGSEPCDCRCHLDGSGIPTDSDR